MDLYGNAVAEHGTNTHVNTHWKKMDGLYPFWMEKEMFQLVALSKCTTVNTECVCVCVCGVCV